MGFKVDIGYYCIEMFCNILDIFLYMLLRVLPCFESNHMADVTLTTVVYAFNTLAEYFNY